MASSASEGQKPAARFWWQGLKNPSGQPLPLNTVERLRWYEKHVRRKRIGYYAVELVVLVVSASIPAAAAAGASTMVAGILGALVTALVGTRQLFRLEADWIRFSGTLTALQAEVVSYSVGSSPYQDAQTAAGVLATNTERLVAAETAQWSALREQKEQS
jgi:Protein of unknown function (DUF4231)